MVRRGQIYWCDLAPAVGSAPAKRRPVLVISDDRYNRSRLATVIVATLTTNTGLAAMPGNVFLSSTSTGLPRDSVVNVTALAMLDRRSLDEHPAGGVPEHLMDEVDSGLRQVLGLA